MGFLDKLVKKGVDSLIENVANTVTDAVNNAMGSTHTNNGTGNVNQGTYKEPVQRNVTSGEYREKPVAQKMTNERRRRSRMFLIHMMKSHSMRELPMYCRTIIRSMRFAGR